MSWKIILSLLLLSGCNEDPSFNVRLYQGRSSEVAVQRVRDGHVIESVGCDEPRFNEMTCAWTEELVKEVRRIQRLCGEDLSPNSSDL